MEILQAYLGSGPEDVSWWQMCLRAAIVFVFAVILFRLAPRRSFGRSTAFDIVLAVVLGSMLSRTLTANAPLVPTLAASAVLVLLHTAVAKIALFSNIFGSAVKGTETRLVLDGQVDRAAMKRANVTMNDLVEALRTNGGVTDVKEVRMAYLERSGQISVIRSGT